MATTSDTAAPDAGQDVIVVGSGLGGLTAAAYLAAAGRRVLVLEQHDHAGGNSQVFRRKDFEFDVGLHYLGDCGPGGVIPTVLRGVGLEERVSFREMDPDGFDTLLFPDLTFRVPKGWDAFRDRLVETFPDEERGIDEFLAVMRAVSHEAPAITSPEAKTEGTSRWGLRSLADLFEHCGLSERAAGVLDYMNGLYGSSPSDTVVFMHALVLAHYMGGAYYPRGGGQVIAARLVEVIETRAGEVRTLSEVEEILVAAGRVRGVRLASGEVLEAPVVISNADYKRTVLELVDRDHLSDETIDEAEQTRMSLPLVCVYVVIDQDLRGRLPNTNFLIFPSYDIDGEYARLEAGEVTAAPFTYLSFASLKDPDSNTACPPGHTNFQIMTMAPRGYGVWGIDEGPAHGERYRRNPRYRSLKERYTEQLLEQAEKVLGPFREHIVHLETATPLTQERYTLSTGGTSYGLRHSPDQSGPFRPSHRAEIDGLYLAGANTRTGHGIAGVMVGGLACAGEVLGRPLLVEVFGGTVLVDPASLPPTDAEWDPVEVCQGRALRQRRASGRTARATTPG